MVIRLVAFVLVVVLSGCAKPEKPVFEAFDFDYLTKIKLDVGAVEVDDGWVPRGSARHVEYLAPTRPTKAMRLMAEQRLVPGGAAGTAALRIDDASIALFRGRFEGNFAVHLDVLDADGQQVGMVNARVRDSEAAREELELFHTPAHIDFVMARSDGFEGYLDEGDTPAFRGVHTAAAAAGRLRLSATAPSPPSRRQLRSMLS
jgi:hypothetical protein